MLDRKFHHRKNNGVHQANAKHGQMGDGPSHNRPLMCLRWLLPMCIFSINLARPMGPAGMKLEYRYAEFKNLAFDLE